MNSKILQSQPSWTLFFSWGAFVFLSVNFFIGVLLSTTSSFEFIVGNVVAFILLAITLYPTVYLSIKYNLNCSQAIQKFVSDRKLQYALILLVVVINIGWYSIQLTAISTLLENYFTINCVVVILILSYLFAYGSFRFEYQWLKNFGIITMVLFFIYLIVLLSNSKFASVNTNTQSDVSIFTLIIMIYGTWAFSSSTVVMDIARYTKDINKSYLYILLAMIFSNFFLIVLGYMFGRYTGIRTFEELLLFLGTGFGVMLFVLNIWSTNDSNFFSSSKALESLKINKNISFMILPFISALLAISFQDDLFSLIGSWLKLMGLIAVPLTLFWWYKVYKFERQSNIL